MKFVQATHAAPSNEDPMIARDNQGTIAGELDPDRDRNRRQNRQNGGPGNSVLFGPAQIIALAESLSRRASPVRPAISKDFAAATLTGTAEAERQASPAASEDQENGAATSALAAGAANAASGEVDTAHPVGRSGGIPEQPQAEEAEPDVRTGSSDDLDGPQAEQAACPDPREFVSSPDMRPAAEEEAEAAPASGPDPDEASAIGDDAGLTSVTNGDALDLTVADDLPVDADALARRSFVLEPEEGAEPRHEEAAPSSSGAAPRVWGYGRPVLEDSRGAVGSGRRSLFGNRKGSTGSGSALDRLRAYQKLLQARASSRSAPPVPASPDPELQVTRQGSRSADHLGLLAEPAVPPEPETELEPAPDSEALRVADIPPEAGDPEDQEEVAARRAGDEDGSRVAPDDPMLNEERHPSAESNHEITSPSPNLVGGPSLDGEPLAALDHKVALEPVIVEDDLGGRAANSDAQTEPVGPSTQSDPASDPVLVVPEVSATPQSHASTGPDDASDEIREASDTLADAAGASPDGGSGAGMDQDNVADASAPNDHGGTTVGLENLVAGADAAAPTLNESDQCGRVDPDVREDPVDAEIRAGANPIARRVSGRREPHATMRAIARLRSWQGAFQRRRDGAGPANAEATTAGAEPIDAIGMDTVRQQVEPVVEGAESLTLTAIGAITEAESAASPVSRPKPPQRRPRATPEIERAAKPRPEHEPASVAEAELGLGVRKRVPARGTRSNTVTAAARGHSAEATPPGDDNKLDSVGKRGRRHWEPGGRRFEDHRDRLRDRTDMSYGRRTSRNDDMAPHRFAGGGGGVEAPWMDLEGILRCMRRRRLFISTIVGVVTLAVVIAVLAVTPRFSATAKVKVADARSAQTLDRPLDPTILYTDEEAIESEVQVITSPQIAHRVIDELGILDDLAPSAAAARAEREAGHRVTLELPRETLGA
ncbi:MAG: hypothetical protein IPM60_04015 [Rhodospirillales bacterium]|nr:hypothetical protein [Rhodospirillales bacterium]